MINDIKELDKIQILSASIYFSMKNKKLILQWLATNKELDKRLKNFGEPKYEMVIFPFESINRTNEKTTIEDKKSEKETIFEMFADIDKRWKSADDLNLFVEDITLAIRLDQLRYEWMKETGKDLQFVVFTPFERKSIYKEQIKRLELWRNLILTNRVNVDKKNDILINIINSQYLNYNGTELNDNEEDEIIAAELALFPYLHYFLLRN